MDLFSLQKKRLSKYSVRLHKQNLKIVLAVVVSLSLISIAGLVMTRHQRTPDPRLATPAILLREIFKSGSQTFLSPEFVPFLPEDHKSLIPSIDDCLSGASDQSVFWKLNRDHHFEIVLLGNNPAWSPLLKSLLNSPLWVLADVSPWGFLFQHRIAGSSEWKIPTETALQEHWPRTNDRALFMIRTAANLTAINHVDQAGQLLEMAATTHELPSMILSAEASLAACRGDWMGAGRLARGALKEDQQNGSARETLVRALIEEGLSDEALENAKILVETKGGNPSTLFLLARAANVAHSRTEEIDALARLVAVAKAHNQPLGASLTYLGQAYATNGQRSEALHAFQEAIACPELKEDEKKAIREVMDHLMHGNTPSNTLPPLKHGIIQQSGSNP